MMLACFARFSCCFTIACLAFCLSSGRATSTALCAATSNVRATLPSQKMTLCRILTKANPIFYHPAIFASEPDVAYEHKLIADLESRANLLPSGPGIDRADVQVEAIKNCVTLGWLTLLENFPVKLLHQ